MEVFNYAKEHHEIKPSLFRESENMDRLLQAIFDVCDEQQNKLLWLAENILNLDLATGYHLDFIGSIVGQPRFLTDFNTEPYFGYEGSYQSKTFGSSLDPEVGGYWNSRSHFNTATSRRLTDEEYRRLIKARVIFNQSNCTANELLEVINLITNSNNNTVQLMKHGLIQIKTDDQTGTLPYFVDRLYNEDNILPIAAGVRVGLEQVVDSGGGGGTEECTPTTLPIIYKEGVNEPTGELYGRYRINGGDWVDYTVLADYYLVNNFLVDTGVMERQGGSHITPFQYQMGYSERLIRGASAQEPYTDGQDGVISVERTTIDFQITDGGANDLVQLLFGGDASVSSCAVGSWYGV